MTCPFCKREFPNWKDQREHVLYECEEGDERAR